MLRNTHETRIIVTIGMLFLKVKSSDPKLYIYFFSFFNRDYVLQLMWELKNGWGFKEISYIVAASSHGTAYLCKICSSHYFGWIGKMFRTCGCSRNLTTQEGCMITEMYV